MYFWHSGAGPSVPTIAFPAALPGAPNLVRVCLICSAMRSRKVLPSFTSSRLLAFSSPIDVPSPPLSFSTAVCSSRAYAGHQGRVAGGRGCAAGWPASPSPTASFRAGGGPRWEESSRGYLQVGAGRGAQGLQARQLGHGVDVGLWDLRQGAVQASGVLPTLRSPAGAPAHQASHARHELLIVHLERVLRRAAQASGLHLVLKQLPWDNFLLWGSCRRHLCWDRLGPCRL